MCSIFLAYGVHPRYRLIVAANRDEFFDRPTAPAQYWPDRPTVLAGRDLRGGGTWLGVGARQRFAAVTNFRDPAAETGHRSRGSLVADFIAGDEQPSAFMEQAASEGASYSGFNLLVADANELYYFSNRGPAPKRLTAGVYGLSNHLLDTPWPKVARGKARLTELLAGDRVTTDGLFDLLTDDAQAVDRDLPDTGVGIERERVLSPIFIRTPIYGTRSATIVLIDHKGEGSFTERTFEQPADKFIDRYFALPASDAVKVEGMVTC